MATVLAFAHEACAVSLDIFCIEHICHFSYNPTTCTSFSNLFWKETLHVSDSSSVHHQEFFTVHKAVVYVICVFLTACKQDQDGTKFEKLVHLVGLL
jgi:hypothetical protein